MNIRGTFIVLTPGFPASEEDSTCLPMQQSFVRMLHRLYPHIRVIIISFQYPYVNKKYKWHNATVYSLNGRNKGGVTRLWLRLKILRLLRNIKKSEKVVGVLSFWYGECAAVGKLFAGLYGIKHRCWLLGQDARKGNKYPSRCGLQPNEMIALSDFVLEEFERNYLLRPANVIPPGIDPYSQQAVNVVKDIDIIAVGSLIPLKQMKLVVETVAEIKKTNPQIKIKLVGEGAERHNLQKQIEMLQLADNCQLVGELPHQEVLQLMRRSKLLLHPSSYEGFGVVCLEALAAGAHVVSFVQPMKRPIDHWYVVSSKNEMIAQASAVLEMKPSVFTSNLVFTMQDTVKAVMNLFNVDRDEGKNQSSDPMPVNLKYSIS